MELATHLFNCANCKCQVTICSKCYRGNIYCKQCRISARKKSLLAAAKKYQNSYKGKLNNAKRQQAYRQRQQKKSNASHFPKLLSNALLPLETAVPTSVTATTICPTNEVTWICDFCDNYGKYN